MGKFLDLDAFEDTDKNGDDGIYGLDYDSAGSLVDFVVYTQDVEVESSDVNGCDEGESNPKSGYAISDFYRFSLQTQANPFFSTKKYAFSHQDGKYKFSSNFVLKDQIAYEQKYGTTILSSSGED